MSLSEAMAAAKGAAEQLPAVQDTSGVPVQYGTGLDDFLSGGLQVDSWIQIKDAGFRLDREDKAFIDEFEADLDLSSVQLFVGIRAEFAGNQVEYRQSVDGGKTTTRGENFAALSQQWRNTAIKPCDPYRGANMVLVLSEDITQGKATIPAGTRIGYTTPVTGFVPFQNILKQLAAEGKVQDAGGGRVTGGVVRVKCTHEARENNAKQGYGVLLMEVLPN